MAQNPPQFVTSPVRYDQVTLQRRHFEPGPLVFYDEDFARRFERARLLSLYQMLQENENRDKYAGEEYFP